ncbi:hypothetical protein LEP1GSC047_0803 [Leptospira inadai serovar Lyme str. 10]|uniref:Uncharacterized protein n=2 Tax=Leptospira inadai serovar Lyme TaxID=293084 RepID=V6HDE5_9LEPT|nr:hypothetical protein [Leptospira inadai]EQA37108.1 hypothetical protein LEP1GSC047_0803 [Leptospira inadai serovar Lyme str. 10]PNV76663.1 hypothetical protein BES34_003540 [Leptospira inadai serovar Lyme]
MNLEMMSIVNAGIGIIRAGQARIENTKMTIKKGFEDLAAKGAADKSESSVRLRDLTIKVVDSVKETNTTIQKNWDEVRSKLSNTVNGFSTKQVEAPIKKGVAKPA